MNWKKLGRRMLFPHPLFIIIFVPAAAALLAYSFLLLESQDPRSIAAYVCSFYALTLLCLRAPDLIRFFIRFRHENRYAARYASDLRLRMNISLAGSFAFSACYAIFQLGLGLWHRSVWFYAMAGYYFLLAVMRLLLARYTGRHTPGENQRAEWRKYLMCGVCLLLTTLALTVFIIYFVWKIRVFEHHEITTIAMAAYTFLSFGMAVRNAVRSRSYGSPAYSAAMAVSLAASLVSVLTLENAMLTAFGQESGEAFRRIMLGATGAGVILTVQCMAVYMIRRAGKALKPRNPGLTEQT